MQIERLDRHVVQASDLETRLLANLADRGVLGLLTGLDMAMNSLPRCRTACVERTLKNEDAPPLA